MGSYKHPSWWKNDYDSAWERTKQAFRRDWEQTKRDMGSKSSPELDQDVDDTIAQAAGKRPIPPGDQPNFDSDEPAYKYGYGARQHFGNRYPAWNDELERQLSSEWGDEWSRKRDLVRRGWEYQEH